METSKSFSDLETYKAPSIETKTDFQDSEDVKSVIKAIISGDSDKFAIITEKYRDKVLQIAWRLTGNFEDTLDISQEAFIRIYRALGSYKGNAKFSTWMYRVVMNTALDYIRWQAKHYRGRVNDYEVETNVLKEKLKEGVEKTTPFDYAKKSELKRRVYKALENLSPMQKKCFVLKYYNDFKISQIADVLGIKDGTVKKHLFRGAKKLKKILKEKW